jgi:hypothetical protein
MVSQGIASVPQPLTFEPADEEMYVTRVLPVDGVQGLVELALPAQLFPAPQLPAELSHHVPISAPDAALNTRQPLASKQYGDPVQDCACAAVQNTENSSATIHFIHRPPVG